MAPKKPEAEKSEPRKRNLAISPKITKKSLFWMVQNLANKKIDHQNFWLSKTQTTNARPPKITYWTAQHKPVKNRPQNEKKINQQKFLLISPLSQVSSAPQNSHLTSPPNKTQLLIPLRIRSPKASKRLKNNKPKLVKYMSRREQFKSARADTSLEQPCVANPCRMAAINHLKIPTKCHPRASWPLWQHSLLK